MSKRNRHKNKRKNKEKSVSSASYTLGDVMRDKGIDIDKIKFLIDNGKKKTNKKTI